MNQFSRRTFIKATALAIGTLPFGANAFASIKSRKAKLSFSTLGCPGWDFQKIVNFAAEHKYDGIEFRGINGELDLTKAIPFNATNIASTKRMLQDKKLKIVNLGSSAQMHHEDEAVRTKHLDDAKAYIDLAHKLESPYIRVFPEKLEGDHEKCKHRIAESLLQLGEYAKNSNVTVLIESHGNLVYVKDLLDVMTWSKHQNVGLIWDFMNMWVVTGESPEHVYPSLAPFIRHVHVKDGIKNGDKINYVLLGKGEVPVRQALGQLVKGNYNGYYSFEWEKLWHPEIAEPEIALADYPSAVQQYLK
jgi:sugar phosphate isomerase/epimerase